MKANRQVTQIQNLNKWEQKRDTTRTLFDKKLQNKNIHESFNSANRNIRN